MHRWTRSWVTTVVAWIAVLFIGGAAIAGVGSVSSKDKAKNVETQSVEESESPEPAEVETSEVEESGEGEKADNHGQCVQTWAHKAKEGLDGSDPLEGRYFGGFVSAVAQTDHTGADCDQSELFAEWLAKQDAAAADAESEAATHGKSAENKGKGKKASDESGDDGDSEEGETSGS